MLDICCVLVFVIIGRASHASGETLAGIASTAWPFLAGLGIGWLACRAWRYRAWRPASPGDAPRTPDPGGLVPAGICAWLATVAFGMVLRVVSGQGTAVSFIVVALVFLGATLLGWRALSILLAGRRGHVAKARGGNQV